MRAWDRYLIMNTTTAPASVQGIVEKKISRPAPIDLNEVLEQEAYECPTFKELMEGKIG